MTNKKKSSLLHSSNHQSFNHQSSILQSSILQSSIINLYPSNLQFSILQYITPTGFLFFRGTSFIYKHTTPPGLVIFQSYYFVPVCLWRNLSLPFRPFVVFNQPSTFIHQTFNSQSFNHQSYNHQSSIPTVSPHNQVQ